MRSTRQVCVSLFGMALLTACGSTVTTAGTTATDATGLSLANPTATAPGQTGTPDPAATSATTTIDPGTTAPQDSSTDTPTGTSTNPATGTTAMHLGPGVDAKTIRIGMTVQDNNATVSSLAQTYNITLADNRGAYDALVHYFNTHGGIAGRTLTPVYYTYDPTGGTVDQIGQAACAAFTDDRNVFAAIDAISVDSFNTCMQRHGRVMLPYGLYFGAKSAWQRYPNVVAADGLPFDDGGRILAEHLSAAKFLTKATKLGAIVRSSADLTDAYQKGFVPALAKAGLKVAQTQYIRDLQGSADISGYTADISSAVLKFRSSGVDRVVFFDTGSYAATVFSQNAEQQQYRPKYGFMSINSIVSLQGSSSTAPRAQMVGAQGVSWETNADGLSTTKTKPAQKCLSILKDAGIVPSDTGTEASYLKTCQTFFLFKAAADVAGANLTRDTFIAAAEGLGSSFVSTNSWNGLTQLGINHHAGVSVFRPFAYKDQCSCFQVSGPTQSVSAP